MLAVTAVACVGEKVHTQEMLTERERERRERGERGKREERERKRAYLEDSSSIIDCLLWYSLSVLCTGQGHSSPYDSALVSFPSQSAKWAWE